MEEDEDDVHTLGEWLGTDVEQIVREDWTVNTDRGALERIAAEGLVKPSRPLIEARATWTYAADESPSRDGPGYNEVEIMCFWLMETLVGFGYIGGHEVERMARASGIVAAAGYCAARVLEKEDIAVDDFLGRRSDGAVRYQANMISTSTGARRGKSRKRG